MIVVIPARGGSKGVPGKNIKEFGGKPLIQYTIDAARDIFKDKDIIVSTDSEKIKTSVESLGLKVPFLRPAELGKDTSGSQEVLLHALSFVESKGFYPQTLILLQPTSPFRNSSHIEEALKLYNNDLDMVVSVKETKSNPYYVLKEENSQGFLENSKKGEFIRRQDCPEVWELNGAIYIINVKSLKSRQISEFKKVKKYVMDEVSSHDIDTEMDWFVAEILTKDSK
ncbi:N-acylneuraminate cytidylyltransferase [Gillisia mitskevichiae]|uniref:N-acylneuraminate cytidylyltransferase n=1 Tax=Gillisia mitskevichiae TaxID=270921 RepID=A0A495PIM0_9FLAO|nr:acylneuraminate cytidylyltransferase family protein [Gillisia mitskevichiae]RKS50591.1 N-acylneuraminate cytidylyltransferase [Gillisia mitskevichiae]